MLDQAFAGGHQLLAPASQRPHAAPGSRRTISGNSSEYVPACRPIHSARRENREGRRSRRPYFKPRRRQALLADLDFQGSRVTSDGGLVLVRELNDRSDFLFECSTSNCLAEISTGGIRKLCSHFRVKTFGNLELFVVRVPSRGEFVHWFRTSFLRTSASRLTPGPAPSGSATTR